MVKWPNLFGAVLLSGGMLLAGGASGLFAAAPASSDLLSGDRADTIDLGSVRPIAAPAREAVKPLPGGNPLWSVPLSVLTATQERPIFSAGRRPAPQAVVAPPQLASAPPQSTAEPEHPPLTLIGAVVGDSEAIAVFLDRTSQKIVRLRQGESHAGWLLSSVQRREVTLRRADQTEMLGLQRQEGSTPVVALPAPGAVSPAGGGFNTSYAPFTPRSTPKNGESDGL